MAQCPTCGSKETEDDNGYYGRVSGTYILDGKEHVCDCETQITLRKHYTLAGIPDQYMRLDWANFEGSSDAVDSIDIYLNSWDTARSLGMGLEFASPNLGVGKTFAATYVGKELIKRSEKVFFVPFIEIINLYSKEQSFRDEREDLLKDVTVLILDEVIPAISNAQHDLFSSKFEELIRHRTNFNRPTIMTTNLTQDELREEYPRSYSLLEAKQIRVVMTGDDYREGARGMRNIELLANNELEPLT